MDPRHAVQDLNSEGAFCLCFCFEFECYSSADRRTAAQPPCTNVAVDAADQHDYESSTKNRLCNFQAVRRRFQSSQQPRKQLATKAARKSCPTYPLPRCPGEDAEEDNSARSGAEEPDSNQEQSESSESSRDRSYDSDGEKLAGKDSDEERDSDLEVVYALKNRQKMVCMP